MHTLIRSRADNHPWPGEQRSEPELVVPFEPVSQQNRAVVKARHGLQRKPAWPARRSMSEPAPSVDFPSFRMRANHRLVFMSLPERRRLATTSRVSPWSRRGWRFIGDQLNDERRAQSPPATVSRSSCLRLLRSKKRRCATNTVPAKSRSILISCYMHADDY